MGCNSSLPDECHHRCKKEPFSKGVPSSDSTSASSGESFSPRRRATVNIKSRTTGTPPRFSNSGSPRVKSNSMVVVSRRERSGLQVTSFHSQRLPPINETRLQSFTRIPTAELLPRQHTLHNHTNQRGTGYVLRTVSSPTVKV